MREIDESTLNTHLLTEEEHGFHEGSSVRKRNGIYYFVYTDISRGKASCLSYATSKSPLGPFKKGGVIIDNTGSDPDNWNNHGSIAEYNGQWYVFYHRASHNSNYSRRTCVEPIYFNEYYGKELKKEDLRKLTSQLEDAVQKAIDSVKR